MVVWHQLMYLDHIYLVAMLDEHVPTSIVHIIVATMTRLSA